MLYRLIFILCFFCLGCGSNSTIEIPKKDYSKILSDSLRIELFTSDKNSFSNSFYLGMDSCETKQIFTRNGRDSQVLKLQFYPKDTVETIEVRGIINNWFIDRLQLEPCLSNYCTHYLKSANNVDLEISFYDESAFRELPYLAIEFFEKEGIAE